MTGVTLQYPDHQGGSHASDARSRQRLTVVAALLLGMVLGAGALRLSRHRAPRRRCQLAEGTRRPHQWTISSLNVLGAGPPPRRQAARWASGPVRMKWLTQVITDEAST